MALVLTRGELRPLIDDLAQLEGAFRAIEEAVLQHQRGEAGQATFLSLPHGERHTTSVFVTNRADAAGVRIFPEAGSAMLPESHVQLLLSGEDGHLIAILGADDLNLLRTSVPIGVGVRHLARPGAKVLGILGSGEQASGHIRAIHHALPGLETIKVFSPTTANRERFAAYWRDRLGKPVIAVATAQVAVEGADVVANTALVRGAATYESAWVKPGAVVTLIGGAPPDELQARLVYPSRQRPAPMVPRHAGPPQSPAQPGIPEPDATLAEVILGEAPAREHADQTILYAMRAAHGWDTPIMRWACEWARARGVGTEIDLSGM